MEETLGTIAVPGDVAAGALEAHDPGDIYIKVDSPAVSYGNPCVSVSLDKLRGLAARLRNGLSTIGTRTECHIDEIKAVIAELEALCDMA